MKRLLASLFALLCLATTADASIILNGNFESPTAVGSFQTLTGSQLSGWTVTSGSIDLVRSYWTPFEGQQSIDLAGSTKNGGAIEQTFATVVGGSYELSFNYANNVDVSTASANVLVIGTVPLLNQDINHSGSISGSLSSMNYTPFSRTFVADSAITTLRFTSTGPHPIINRDNGIVLDNVAVSQIMTSQSVPEPAMVLNFLVVSISTVVARCRRGAQRNRLVARTRFPLGRG